MQQGKRTKQMEDYENDIFEIRYVDAKKAQENLATSKGNRKESGNNIGIFSTDMRNGQWYAGSDAILIDEEGLRNGHTRMYAVIAAGPEVVVPMLFRIRSKGVFSP